MPNLSPTTDGNDCRDPGNHISTSFRLWDPLNKIPTVRYWICEGVSIRLHVPCGEKKAVSIGKVVIIHGNAAMKS